jgi:EmrB/QacA subfamily drug resistance transporter
MGRGGDGRRLLLLCMTLANAMVLVDQTAVPLALPDILRQFAVSSQQVQWVLNASLLPLASLLVLGGRLGDLLGRRRVFLVGTTVFAGASALGGLAPTFMILLVFRVLQGAGGAMMLPNTVAIVSSAYTRSEEGRALGLMGGAAAVAGALGPTIGGILTAALSWRAVLLVNVPLAVITVLATLRAVSRDPRRQRGAHVDLPGAATLGLALFGLVLGLAQSQAWGWGSPLVLGSLLASVAAAVAFIWIERTSPSPLMSFALLRRHPNYLAATISQVIAGVGEMGLALLFPLLLILNLQMSPGVAGLALLPTTLPMVVIAPLAGRWYDKIGGRWPLVTGFAVLIVSGLLLALGAGHNSYLAMLPGLLAFGIGLALVLTVNDPVSLDTIPSADQGQASGVSATAEQFGGAIGIAALYLLFHAVYVRELASGIASSATPNASAQQLNRLKDALQAAEQTGLHPKSFPADLARFLIPARTASDHGYAVAFLAVSAVALVALVVMAVMVRRAEEKSDEAELCLRRAAHRRLAGQHQERQRLLQVQAHLGVGVREIADRQVLAQVQAEVAAPGGQHDRAADRRGPDDVAGQQPLDVLDDRIPVVAGLADLGIGVGAEQHRVRAVHAGHPQLAQRLRDRGRVILGVGGQDDRRVAGPLADALDAGGRVALDDRAVLSERDLLGGVLDRLPVGILRPPRHVVDLLPAQGERRAQLYQRRHLPQPGLNAVARSVNAAHPAGADGGEPHACRALDVHNAPASQVALERAGGLLLDLRPGLVRDRRKLAVQVIHRGILPSGCQYSVSQRCVSRCPPAGPGLPRPPRRPLRRRRRQGFPAATPTARRTARRSPPC